MEELFKKIDRFYMLKPDTFRVCFNNGLSLCVFWGLGSYSDSGDIPFVTPVTDNPRNVELAVMVEGSGEFFKEKLSFFDTDDCVVGRVPVEELPDIMKEVAGVIFIYEREKEDERETSLYN